MNRFMLFCVCSCFALVDTQTSAGRDCQGGDGFSAPSGELCLLTSQCGDSSDDEKQAARDTACGFETDLCGWEPLSLDDADWKIMEGEAPLGRRLAGGGHTANAGRGAFLSFSGSHQRNTEVATSHLGSPFLVKLSPGLSCCQVRFWCQLSQDSQLSVFRRTALDGSLEKLCDMSGLPEEEWRKVNVPVGRAAEDMPFQVVLRATLLTTNAAVAVDDISVTEDCGVLNKSLAGLRQESEAAVCDFERDSCGWTEAAGGDGFDWVRSSSSALPPALQKQAPPRDHTSSRAEGHFMFILQNGSSVTQVARLRSPKFRQTGSNCTLSFWYYNYGQSVGAAEIQLLVDGLKHPTVLWRTYYSEGRQWLKAVIQLGRLPLPFQLSLEKISLGVYDGVSAIDDIIFENCALPPPALSCEGPGRFWCRDTRACIDSLLVCDLVDDCGDGSDEDNCNPELQCDFEKGLCNWEQEVEDDLDWLRIEGPTPTVNTGPLKDHTTGTARGHYLYLESSEPCQFQDKAVLLSPLFNPPANRTCLFRFHYHMFGKQVYKLSVFQRTVSNTKGWLLWYKFGNQGNRWIRQSLSISSSKPFQILVKGTVGDGFTGDIGLDDTSFLGCTLYKGNLPTISTTTSGTSVPATLPKNNCTEEEFVCRASARCIRRVQRCDFRPDCADGSDESACVMEVCSFEDRAQCGWYQPALEQTSGTGPIHSPNIYKWELGRGANLYPGQEKHCPLTDHTTRTEEGWYLFADSSNGEFGHTADVATPVISLTGPKCKLIFWSHMNGSTIGSLEVLCKTNNRTARLWSQSGSQGPQWNRAEVFLGIRSEFQVVFRAKRGVSYMGDVALDDITFEDCAPLLIPGKACTSEEFTCANQHCIPKDSLCDFVNDCADHSDESPAICSTSIGHCSFEFDLCGWQQDEDDDFDWNLRTSSTSLMGTGPATDHTLQEPSGHYLFIKSSFLQLPGQRARISSPVLSRRNTHCQIHFYYHMCGAHVGSLTVYQRTTGKEKILLSLTGNQGNYWQHKALTLAGDGEEDFQVVFEGIAGKGPKDGIALDDLTFSRECLPPQEFLPAAPTMQPPAASCSRGYWQCLNGKCYSPEQSCDFEDDCGDNTDERECGTSCTFEQGRCGWRNSLANNFNWVLRASSPHSLRPPGDHTLGNSSGQFLYLEATALGLKNGKAHVKSSRWKESSGSCVMSFWYFKSSKAMGRIQVLIKLFEESACDKLIWGWDADLAAVMCCVLKEGALPLYRDKYNLTKRDCFGDFPLKNCYLRSRLNLSLTAHVLFKLQTDEGVVKLWSESEHPAEEWKKVELQLGKRRNFEVLFEGIGGRELGGGAAVDDIEFSNCSSSGEKPRGCPATTDFRCGNQKCLESRFVCDYRPDCEDLSDEARCGYYTSIPGSCDFETQGEEWTTACGLTQELRDDFDWSISSSAAMGQRGPGTDHTPGKGEHFLYVNSSTQKEGSRARIVTTKLFPASLGVCRVRFWFWMFASRQTGVLKVYTAEEHGMDILMWSSSRNEANQWMYGSVVLSSNSPFRVAFEAEVGRREPAEFALDDLSFTPECIHGGPAAPPPPLCSREQFTCAYVQQCVPLPARCNGAEDCTDGSDEMNCPPGMPTTMPSASCKQAELLCPSTGCVPSLLMCDGVPDCRLAEDEAGCPSRDCLNGSLLCPSTGGCIAASRRCDGVADCSDFSLDESSCSVCPEEYCKNGGRCILKDNIPLCQCGAEWEGNRCHIAAEPQPPAPSLLQKDTWIVLALGFLLIKITAAAFYFLSRRKVPEAKLEGNTNVSFANPLYEDLGPPGKVKSPGFATSPPVQISVSPWHECPSNEDVNATSFPNPLYGEASEDIEKLCSSLKIDINQDQYCL